VKPLQATTLPNAGLLRRMFSANVRRAAFPCTSLSSDDHSAGWSCCKSDSVAELWGWWVLSCFGWLPYRVQTSHKSSLSAAMPWYCFGKKKLQMLAFALKLPSLGQDVGLNHYAKLS
jgi:hypothetical protein